MGPRLSVVVIEDEKDIREVLGIFLESEGYDPHLFANGKEALDWLERAPAPTIIFLDMKMPVMNGWQFAEAYAKQPGPRSPVVVMTAAADAEARAREIGASGWIGKPFSFEEISSQLRHYSRPPEYGRSVG
jgi:CheY-like chemotaxis protein